MGWALAFGASAALAQEPGWHYSQHLGEGDRAAAGCNREATPTNYVCLTVRCEDDYSVGLYIVAFDRPAQLTLQDAFQPLFGSSGKWTLTIDREPPLTIEGASTQSPHGARVLGDVADIIDGLENGGLAYLDKADGSISAQIQLTGSLQAINQALFFCAPRVVPEPPAEAPATN